MKNKNEKKSISKLESSSSLITLKYNSKFCNDFFEKNMISSVVDFQIYSEENNANLVYDVSKLSNSNSEIFQTIIDLLLQLRASQSEQNIFVQNNTVLKEQILKQLKSEIFRVSHKLNENQIKNLEVISSNSFDEKTLTDILNSFLRDSKKKSDGKLDYSKKISVLGNLPEITFGKNILKYSKNIENKVINENISEQNLNKFTYKKHLIDKKSDFSDIKSPKNKKGISRKKILNKFLNTQEIQNLILEESENLNVPYDVYEQKIIKKAGILLPLVKIQSKFLENRILDKTKLFVNEIIEKNTSKILPSETELVNKILVKTQLNELRENISRNYERYDYYNSKHQTEIKSIQSKIKKLEHVKSTGLYNSKQINKSFEVIDLNTKNKIKKNIIKFASGKEITNKFETISENFFQDYLQKKEFYHGSFINKIVENKSKENVDKILYDKTNFIYKSTSLSEKTFKDVSEKLVLSESINKKKLIYTDIYKNYFKTLEENRKDFAFRNFHLSSDIENLKNFSLLNSENTILKNKRIIKRILKNQFNSSYSSSQEFLEMLLSRKINNKTYFLEKSEKELNFETLNETVLENLKSSKSFLNLNLAKKLEEFVEYTKTSSLEKNILDFKKRKILVSDELTKKLKNMVLIKSPELVSKMNRFSEFFEVKKMFGISKATNNALEIIHRSGKLNEINKADNFDYDKSYIVYKQNKNYHENEKNEVVKNKPLKEKINKNEEFLVKENPVVVTPEISDLKSMEKRIMEKTLGKKEIMDIINSYMSEINIENISRIIVDKIENKMSIDRRRNGIF